MKNIRPYLLCALLALLFTACSTTRALKDGEYLLKSAKVQVQGKGVKTSELSSYVSQKPNNSWMPGTEPTVYDAALVDKSLSNINNHLRYLGFFGSQVESDIQVKGRKVYVTYYVSLGKRYTISAIDYELPSYGSFREEFMADLSNSTLATGQFLSEQALEMEAERSSQHFRNIGYYGFNKSFYAFEADTLASDGTARLTMSVRDYALGDTPAASAEHRKYHIGQVQITHPEKLKIRPSVLENLNTLRPGQLYSEKAVNTAYTRFTSLNMLSGVNVNMVPRENDKVDCNINLANSGLQGFKTNLEASVNSTSLFGISPQLSYYHKNIFHGGELLNLGVKGNFQFKPGDAAYSTEFSLTSSLRFPKSIGIPNRFFQGPNIPQTEITAAFTYQDRPEFHRTVIAAAMNYTGRLGQRIFYQITPIRAHITRLFDINTDFLIKMYENWYLINLFSDRFDAGVSTMFYYTTDASAIPMRPYHYKRFSIDVSGNVVSLLNPLLPGDEDGIHTIWDTPYAQYVRAEFQTGRTFRFGRESRHALALHFMAGAGYTYGNSVYMPMPMDKMFYAGGSMSMRGWQARTLGPGNDQLLAEIFVLPSQVADMKLEANVEYRFPIVWKLEGALFADVGNIWDIQDGSDESSFSLKTLPEAIGLDWGLGLRINLDFILLRLDAGFRLHDPGRDAGDRWVKPKEWLHGGSAVHFGVGYPF